MARVGEANLGRVTRFVAAARAGDAEDPLTYDTLVGLRDLVGADDAEYFELRRSDRGVVAHRQTANIGPDPAGDEALRRFGWQNPLGWRRWKPADGAMRLSGRISRKALDRLEFSHAYLRPNGLTDVLKVWLHSDAVSAACVQLWRYGGEFGERDQDLLAIVQHDLIRLRAEAVARQEVPEDKPLTLTRREAEMLTWAVRGASDAEIATRFGMSPGTVGKHLENAFARLGVHSRAEALWRVTGASQAAQHPVVGWRARAVRRKE